MTRLPSTAQRLAGWSALCLLLMTAGCRDAGRDSEVDDDLAAPADTLAGSSEVTTEFAPGLAVNLNEMQRTDSGIYIQDVEVGAGEPAELGRHVEVHYTGRLADGTIFDSSYEAGETIDFVLGTGAVIEGWEQGLIGMREGGRRRLIIPPALAYGRDGYGVIPPNATLIFETELVRVQ
jgi:FKBP-type peptidyl-prolyl cis-trans isomerase